MAACAVPFMKFCHQGISCEIDDAWLVKAGMVGFTPSTQAYPVPHCESVDGNFLEVATQDIQGVSEQRRQGGIFRDSPEGTAQDRVVRILQGFRLGDALPAVEVVKTSVTSPRYKLTHGTHRLYCSVAVGFTHVPTLPGFDWDAM